MPEPDAYSIESAGVESAGVESAGVESAGVGQVIGPVRIAAVAHGGHFVGRHEGRVLFVRDTAPGELVMVRLTDVSRPSFWRADAVELLEASPDRVPAPCPISGRCGGCDFQHLTAAAQRRTKAQVVAEQFERLAGIDVEALTGRGVDDLVEPADADHPDELLGWRTRMRYRTRGVHLAMREHRSNALVDLPDQVCLIAEPRATGADVAAFAPASEILAVVSDDAEPTVLDLGRRDAPVPLVHQRVNDISYEVSASGFWQVHPHAAAVLSDAVIAALHPRPGERALDLYCGVGLFAGQLAAAGVRVTGFEADADAVASARRNVPRARFQRATVERAARKLPDADLVVLDPPRKGAGAAVCGAVAGRRPRAIAYVACDPASLARDVATFAQHGYRIVGLRAFDLFPMTHHVECVALLEPDAGGVAAG